MAAEEKVYTSPAGLLRTREATKSTTRPALRDLEGIKSHYGSDFTSLLASMLHLKTAEKPIFFLPI